MTLVLDASVVLAWLFADERADRAEQSFRQTYAEGACVPALLATEVANALNVGVRRGRMSTADRDRAVAVVRALPLEVDPFSVARTLTEVADLARRHELSVYDATYLELAHRRGLPLATFDERLSAAAPRAGVALWGTDPIGR